MDGAGGLRRWPWLLAAGMFLIAGLGAARSAYLFWAPCHDSMLTGSLIRTSKLHAEFSDACLRRMDTGSPFLLGSSESDLGSWTAAAFLSAMIIASIGWLVVALGLRWGWQTKIVTAAPGVATPALGALTYVWGQDINGTALGAIFAWIVAVTEFGAIPVLVAVWNWQPQVRGLRFICLAVMLNGVGVFGVVRGMADYIFMSMFNSSNWDTPPGAGVSSVLWLLASAIFAVIGAFAPPRKARSGQVGLLSSNVSPVALRQAQGA